MHSFLRISGLKNPQGRSAAEQEKHKTTTRNWSKKRRKKYIYRGCFVFLPGKFIVFFPCSYRNRVPYKREKKLQGRGTHLHLRKWISPCGGTSATGSNPMYAEKYISSAFMYRFILHILVSEQFSKLINKLVKKNVPYFWCFVYICRASFQRNIELRLKAGNLILGRDGRENMFFFSIFENYPNFYKNWHVSC